MTICADEIVGRGDGRHGQLGLSRLRTGGLRRGRCSLGQLRVGLVLIEGGHVRIRRGLGRCRDLGLWRVGFAAVEGGHARIGGRRIGRPSTLIHFWPGHRHGIGRDALL